MLTGERSLSSMNGIWEAKVRTPSESFASNGFVKRYRDVKTTSEISLYEIGLRPTKPYKDETLR